MNGSNIQILPADLGDARIVKLLVDHFDSARAQTAPGSAHALDLQALRMPGLTVWSAWRDNAPVSVGALKRLSTTEGEIKSMYTTPSARRYGLARAMLTHIISLARQEGLARLSLETGSWPYFEPARSLYKHCGFIECGPFGDYREDVNSVFLTLGLSSAAVNGPRA
jgi:putative acetyltransferase